MINKRITSIDIHHINQIDVDYLSKIGFIKIITTLLITLLISGCDPISMISPRIMNYVVVDYHNDNIVFYLSSEGSMSSLPDRLISFDVTIYNQNKDVDESTWDFVTNIKCSNKENAYNMAKLVYGDTPKCFRNLVKVNKLLLNETYKVYGYVPKKKYEGVIFRLIKCKGTKNICLETNSPVSLLGN